MKPSREEKLIIEKSDNDTTVVAPVPTEESDEAKETGT